jgi:hypothetical protein
MHLSNKLVPKQNDDDDDDDDDNNTCIYNYKQ